MLERCFVNPLRPEVPMRERAYDWVLTAHGSLFERGWLSLRQQTSLYLHRLIDRSKCFARGVQEPELCFVLVVVFRAAKQKGKGAKHRCKRKSVTYMI